MRELVSLVELINRKKISDKYILKSELDGSKQDKLYLALKAGEVKTDKEATDLLYGDEFNKATYQRLKSRLKDKMLNSLLTMDLSLQKYSSLKNAYYKILKNYTIANMLRLEGNRLISIALLEDTLTYSLKYEVTEYTKLISSQLSEYYSIQNIEDKKREKYQAIYDNILVVESHERKANSYYYELSNMYIKKDSIEDEFLIKLKKYSEELTESQKTVKSYNYNLKTFSINSTLYIFKKQYQMAIDNATKALAFFDQKPFDTINNSYTFNVDIIMSNILLENYMEAGDLINKTLLLMQNKNQAYYRLYHLKFITFAHWKNYESLLEIVDFVLNSKEITQYQLQFELWKIREAYVNFLIEANFVERSDTKENINRFRLAKFMNNVPNFSKEKRGMNVSIIVIQLLFFIVRREYNEVIDRMDALRQYSFRYLRKDSTFRSNCFIKMLLKIPEADFHPVRTKLYTKDLVKKLYAHKIDYETLTNEIEVIPFHFLWDIILEVLENNR